MLQAWAGNLPTQTRDQEWSSWLEAAIGRVMCCNMRLAKAKKHFRGFSVRMHTKKIQLAESQLQGDPTNEKVRDILSDSQAKLAEIYQDQVSRNQHLSSANWFRYGDTCSKTFFDFHRIGKKKTILRELETENGPITGQSDLSHYVTDFYARLYSSETHVPGTQEAQERCWDSVLVRVA
ncbi:unnamed protein product [Sphagnum jensenii]|jgi:hypothetical protein|uniref:Uncharacterized protein n=1 Tax=Sphagnum jensenii TaxID=128206 RepID=A0ABP0WI82_9BRYO